MKYQKLGRGIEEISHLFLSTEVEEDKNILDDLEPIIESSRFNNYIPHNLPVYALGITGIKDEQISCFLACNLAIEMARQGYQILIVDDDLNQYHVSELMGLSNINNSIFLKGPMGVRLISMIDFKMALLSQNSEEISLEYTESFERFHRFDIILVNSSLEFIYQDSFIPQIMDEVIVLSLSNPYNMLDSYQLIKGLLKRNNGLQFGLVVGKTDNFQQADRVFQKFSVNVKRFLNHEIKYYSYIPDRKEIDYSISAKIPLVLSSTSSELRKNIYDIAHLLIKNIKAYQKE